jgi:hypothetical protein
LSNFYPEVSRNERIKRFLVTGKRSTPPIRMF